MSTAASTLDVRASSLPDCARKAAYGAIGAPRREWTDSENRILFRGTRIGQDYADFLEREHGPLSIEREVEIPWRFGVGHADILFKPAWQLIEVLSSARASASMLRRKLLQLVLYMEHHSAKSGVLVVINPSDFSETRHPVARGAPPYQSLAAEVHERIERIARWRDTGELPERECLKPSDAIGRFCPHAAHCFEGWEAPSLEEIDTPTARTVAAAYYQAKREERAAAATLKTAEGRRKELEGELADHVPEGKWKIGALAVSRTHVTRKPTVSPADLELAGIPIPDELWRTGSEYDTWRVDRISNEPLDDDYGDVPF